MLFNSIAFAIFLPIVFAFYWLIPNKYRYVLLLVASYYFYMSWNIKYVFLILFTTVVSYYSAILLEKQLNRRKKKCIIALALILCLGVLFFFKYFNFVSQSISNTLKLFTVEWDPLLLKVLLPVGISFYTFQTLSYVVDVYRGDVQAERHFGYYATFVSFFPQLVAGPIERPSNLLPQIKAHHTFNYEKGIDGIKLMIWGYFKKLIIADGVARYVDLVFDNVFQFEGLSLILVVFFFTVQIYCDFSGYSDIARGVAKLMDIDLMENFKSPYLSSSLKEFWSRWHISLSTWFRDYVYIPLGGNRRGKTKTLINLFLTFVVSGLWHGASWTFVIWGAIHGLGQIIEKSLGLSKQSNNRIIILIRTVAVFIFTSLAWIFFRAQTFGEAIYVIRNMFNGINSPFTYVIFGFNNISLARGNLVFYAICIALLLLYDYLQYTSKSLAMNKYLQFALYSILVVIIAIQCGKGMPAEFVYFQF